MVVTRSSLDTGRGLPVKVSWGSQKTRNMTNPLSSEQLGQKRKSASDPSKSEEPARKKHAKENRFATARSSDVAPLNKKRKSGQGDPLPSGHQSTGPASDFEAPCFKKLKVANPATEKSSGRKLLSPGPTLLSMPREIRDMILGDTFGNRTLHIEQGNTWSKSVNIYQISDRNALRHAVCQACGTTRHDLHTKAGDRSEDEGEPRTYFQRHLKCCRPSSDHSRGYETPSFVSNEAEHITPAILRTCHQLHDEGTKILYGSNNFSFTDPSAFQKFLVGRTEAQTSVMQSIELSATAESPESANPLFTTPKFRSERQGFYQSLCSWGLHELGRLDKLRDIRLYYLEQTPLSRLKGRDIQKLKSIKKRLIRRGLETVFGELRFLDCVKSSRRLSIKVGEYFGRINCDVHPAVFEPRDSSSFGTLFNRTAGALGDFEVDVLAEEFKAEVVSPVADLQHILHQEMVNDAEQAELVAISAPCIKILRKIQAQTSVADQKGGEIALYQVIADTHRKKMNRYELVGNLDARPYLAAKRDHEDHMNKAALANLAKVAAVLEKRRLQIELNTLELEIDRRVNQSFWPLEDYLHSLKAVLNG